MSGTTGATHSVIATVIAAFVGCPLTPPSLARVPFAGLGILPGAWRRRSPFVSFVVALLATLPATAQVSFTGLGALGGANTSLAHAISADAGTVVGEYYDTQLPIGGGFRWTPAAGMQPLSGLAPGQSFMPYGVSANGSAIAGATGTPDGLRAVRWTQDGGAQNLGILPSGSGSIAYGISDDGTTVVGQADQGFDLYGFRWTAATGLQALPRLAGTNLNHAQAVSADGSVVIGYGEVTENTSLPFRWTAATGTVGLSLPAGWATAEAFGVSADGTVVVGYGGPVPQGQRAFVWSTTGGAALLPDRGVGGFAMCVSGDGHTIGGYLSGEPNGPACLWIDGNSPLLMTDLLGATVPSGWRLDRVTGISFDGTAIAGYGWHNGHQEAWVATVPAPSCLLTLIVCSPAFHRRR
jgi:uncharacterized membrane protein